MKDLVKYEELQSFQSHVQAKVVENMLEDMDVGQS